MKSILRVAAFLLSASLSVLAFAQEQEQRAIDVLKAMSEYKNSLDRFVIRGSSSSDARLPDGLIVSNTEEITVTVDRPLAMHFNSFDGVNTKELYINNGSLSLFNHQSGVYAQAQTPETIDEALEHALEHYDIDLPLMDLLRQNTYSALVDSTDTVLYLTENARVNGVDCHHVAIRTEEVDVQLWIQEEGQPLPRRIMITAKWAGGAPRFVANMDWELEPDIDGGRFDFKPPEDAALVEFINVPAE